MKDGIYEVTITKENTQIRVGYTNDDGNFEYYDTIVNDEDVNGYIQCLEEFGFRRSFINL